MGVTVNGANVTCGGSGVLLSAVLRVKKGVEKVGKGLILR